MTNECTSPLEVVCYVLGTESPESTNPAGLTPTEVAAAAAAARTGAGLTAAGFAARPSVEQQETRVLPPGAEYVGDAGEIHSK